MDADEDDIAYFERRLHQERAVASASSQPEVRDAHLALAALYAERIEEVGGSAGQSSQRHLMFG